MKTNQQLSQKIVRSLTKILGQEVVSFWLEQAGSDQSVDRVLATVTKVEPEAKGAASVWLKPNSNFKGFEAGQHVNLCVKINGVVHTRSYSFSAAPREDGLVRLTVKATPSGVVSGYLVNELSAGEVLELGDVFGDMTLSHTQPDLNTANPEIVMMAAGSGITPMISLIEQLDNLNWPANVTLLSWARQPEEALFDDYLVGRAAANSKFRYVRLLEQGADASRGDLEGRPNAAQLRAIGLNVAKSDVYACGPDGFMKVISGLVGDQSTTPAKSFHAESFTPVQPVVDADAPVQTYAITLTRSNRIVEVPSNKPLLKALQEKGINPPHGCGMGICNTCSCEKLVGTTQNMQNQTVCASGKTALRLCISAAQSPLTLDL